MAATEELRILLRTVADTAGITKTEASLKGIQTQTSAMGRSSGPSLLAFGAAAAVAGVSVDRFAGILGDSVDAARDHERVSRALTASYGAQTAAWVKFANQLSATTGFTSDAIMEAALSARTLSTNYGLSIDQTQKLIKASGDLARIRGIGIAESFERVQSAIRGEAEASEYLGLTLNDTFLTNQAMNGSLKNTFGTMTDVEKAQVRYNELLKQSADFAGLAASNTDSLDGAFNRAGTSAHNLQVELGQMTAPAVITGLKAVADMLDLIRGGGLVGKAARDIQEGLAAGAQGGGGGSGGFRPGVVGRIDPYLDPAVKARYSQLQAQREADARRLREINELPPLDNAATLARLAYMDQLQAAVQDVTTAQDRSLELQKQSVQLSAEEARVRLGLLPAQRQMAELQRDITEQQLRAQLASQPQRAALEDLRYAQDTARLAAQTQTDLAEAQIRARQAALPATEALDDLRYAQDLARLTAQDRNASPEERRQAKRDLRDLGRAEPGVARAALEAQREGTLIGRVVAGADLEQQLKDLGDQAALAAAQLALFKAEEPLRAAQQAGQLVDIAAQLQAIADQRTLAPVLDAQQQTQLQQAITAGVVQAQQDLVQKMVDQQKTPIMLSVNITHADGRTDTYTELIEANGQAQIPPVIQQSGVRRN